MLYATKQVFGQVDIDSDFQNGYIKNEGGRC